MDSKSVNGGFLKVGGMSNKCHDREGESEGSDKLSESPLLKESFWDCIYDALSKIPCNPTTDPKKMGDQGGQERFPSHEKKQGDSDKNDYFIADILKLPISDLSELVSVLAEDTKITPQDGKPVTSSQNMDDRQALDQSESRMPPFPTSKFAPIQPGPITPDVLGHGTTQPSTAKASVQQKQDKAIPKKAKGRNSPSYRCGKCLVPKKGHVCPHKPKLNMVKRSKSTRKSKILTDECPTRGPYECSLCGKPKKNHVCRELQMYYLSRDQE